MLELKCLHQYFLGEQECWTWIPLLEGHNTGSKVNSWNCPTDSTQLCFKRKVCPNLKEKAITVFMPFATIYLCYVDIACVCMNSRAKPPLYILDMQIVNPSHLQNGKVCVRLNPSQHAQFYTCPVITASVKIRLRRLVFF